MSVEELAKIITELSKSREYAWLYDEDAADLAKLILDRIGCETACLFEVRYSVNSVAWCRTHNRAASECQSPIACETVAATAASIKGPQSAEDELKAIRDHRVNTSCDLALRLPVHLKFTAGQNVPTFYWCVTHDCPPCDCIAGASVADESRKQR